MRKIRLGLFAGTSILVFAPVGATAQTSAAPGTAVAEQAGPPSTTSAPADQNDSVGEIIVTAQKRSESVNRVGMSITAASGADLSTRGVTSVADLQKIAPSVTATQSGTNTPVYQIRGVGFFESTLASAPAVSVYQDEVPLPFPAETRGVGLDLERVEVLKGPQGTLFGQNSTGGAINYVAAKPTSTLQSGGDFSIGRFKSLDLSGFVSGPLTSNLKARVSLRTVQRDDWQYSYTRDDKLGKANQLVGRILLEWTPTDRLTVGLNLNGWLDKGDNQANQVNLVSIGNPANAYASVANQPVSPKNDRAADWTANWPMRRDDKFGQASLRLDYELGDSIRLTSLTAGQYFKTTSYADQDGTPASNLDSINRGKIRSVSQEVRLNGEVGALTYIVGGNYSHDKVDEFLGFNEDELSSNQIIPGLIFNEAHDSNTQKIDTYAGFGNLDFAITQQLKVHGGVRYTQIDRSFSGCSGTYDPDGVLTFNILQSLLAGSVVPAVVGGCVTLGPDFHPALIQSNLNQHNVSWRAGLDYQLQPSILAYVNVSKGYKAGSFPTVTASTFAQKLPVTQEALLAYEAGVKAGLFDRHLQLNVSGFYYDYANKQLRSKVIDPIFGLLETLINVPKSRVLGAEAEVTARPIGGLELSGGVTYLDTKVRRFVGVDTTGVTSNFEGARFPYSPKWQAIGDAQYTFSLNERRNLFLGGSAVYHSRTSGSLDATAPLTIDPYTLLDLRAGIDSKDGSWRFSVWGRNVTNKYYWTSAIRTVDTYVRQAGMPATYGISLSLRNR